MARSDPPVFDNGARGTAPRTEPPSAPKSRARSPAPSRGGFCEARGPAPATHRGRADGRVEPPHGGPLRRRLGARRAVPGLADADAVLGRGGRGADARGVDERTVAYLARPLPHVDDDVGRKVVVRPSSACRPRVNQCVLAPACVRVDAELQGTPRCARGRELVMDVRGDLRLEERVRLRPARLLDGVKLGLPGIEPDEDPARSKDGPRAVAEQRGGVRSDHGDEYGTDRESLTAARW